MRQTLSRAKHLTFQLRYACLFGLFLLPSYGALITYTNRPAFNGAAPGLLTDTFAAGLVSPESVTSCNGPLSSNFGSTCFPASGLLPGALYSSTSGTMALLGVGFIGNTSNLLGPNLFSDTLTLTFMQASAVGFDVFAGPNPGDVLISVYSPANALLGSFTAAASASGGFFGVVSNTGLIGHINVNSQASPPGEVIGDVSFGVPSVPEPCSLWLSSAGLIGIALWRRRSLRSR